MAKWRNPVVGARRRRGKAGVAAAALLLATPIGQDRVRENLRVAIAAAKQRRNTRSRAAFRPGSTETTLAYVIANEMGVSIRATSGRRSKPAIWSAS